MNTTVNRSFELGLDFKQIYFLIVGDYPDIHSPKVLASFVKDERLSTRNFIRLLLKS